MEQFLSTEDPTDRTGHARVDRGGSYVTSIVARRPVTGGEFEAATSVNSPVKPTVGEIGEEEIGEDKIGEEEIGRREQEIGKGEQEFGRSRGEIGRSTSKRNKEIFRTKSEALQARARITPSMYKSR